MLTRRPLPRFRIAGRNARLTRWMPTTLISSCVASSSALKASVKPTNIWPALLTTTSGAPDSASTAAAAASTETAEVTSNEKIRRSSFSVCATARSPRAMSAFFPSMARMVAYTRSPLRASCSATSRPNPELQPVITTVLLMDGLSALNSRARNGLVCLGDSLESEYISREREAQINVGLAPWAPSAASCPPGSGRWP